MKILNFGSLNIDRTYEVDHFVIAGQTIATSNYQEFFGGKGLNQSIALARAGAEVSHVGAIGHDGLALKQALLDNGADISQLHELDGHSGHTVIQIDQQGENSILFEAGTNFKVDKAMIDQAFEAYPDGEMIVLLQNEISNVDYIIDQAHAHGHFVAFNPSPMTEQVLDLPLDKVNCFLINETEGQALTGKRQVQEIYQAMQDLYPNASILLTLGSKGAMLHHETGDYSCPALKTKAVDTTGAGDTFTGYFLAGLANDEDLDRVLQTATAASSIAVSKKGAVNSIPNQEAVADKLKETK